MWRSDMLMQHRETRGVMTHEYRATYSVLLPSYNEHIEVLGPFMLSKFPQCKR